MDLFDVLFDSSFDSSGIFDDDLFDDELFVMGVEAPEVITETKKGRPFYRVFETYPINDDETVLLMAGVLV